MKSKRAMSIISEFKHGLYLGLMVVGMALPGYSDWTPGDDYKWVQLPDLTPNGMDVRTFAPIMLADDFLCTNSGPITDIHIWGSWFGDMPLDPEVVTFRLSIWSDIPTNEIIGYSRPGELLWEGMFTNGQYSARNYHDVPEGEGWYDPSIREYISAADRIIWQYNFYPESREVFKQAGTPETPVVYWLGVQALFAMPAPNQFGWKSSATNWNDDAVWAESMVEPLNWQEMRYPINHPFEGRSVDLSFVITTAATNLFDFGDAVDTGLADYPTLLAQNGARHTIVQGVYLGHAIDNEPDGQPDVTATGDDLAGTDDEDGISFISVLTPGTNATLEVVASTQGFLYAWMDFMHNGNWSDPGEDVLKGFPLMPGTNRVPIDIPANAPGGRSFSRFRFTTNLDLSLSYINQASNGEVEDYTFTVKLIDYGDAPSPYPTLLASDGARHYAGGSFMGMLWDYESDGRPEPNAQGDDAHNQDDEDGVIFTAPFIQGQTSSVRVSVTAPCYLNAWIDYNADGDWADVDEQVCNDNVLTSGVNWVDAIVPMKARATNTFTRFRVATTNGLSYVGLAEDGEVEDYEIMIEEPPPPYDFGDAPTNYPTMRLQNGARHIMVTNIRLGAAIDCEDDGQPSALADGDDANGTPDDEDGVTHQTPYYQGSPAMVQVTVSTNVFLNAWFDFNLNGSWADAHEQIFSNVQLAAGVTNLSFAIPGSAMPGYTFARYRVSTNSGLSYMGEAPNGEVEDYRVTILEPATTYDLGDAPAPYPTLLIEGGAVHWTPSSYYLGVAVDSETDGKPDPAALGDDNTGSPDDEDGVSLTANLVRGSNVNCSVHANATNGILNAWFDFNLDGDWADMGEQIAVDLPLASGVNMVPVSVPVSALVGETFARFRYSDVPGLSWTGVSTKGEVEDYRFTIYQPGPLIDIVFTNTSMLISNQTICFELSEMSNYLYQLQYSSNLLTNVVWHDIGGLVRGPVKLVQDTNLSQRIKVYRIRIPYTAP